MAASCADCKFVRSRLIERASNRAIAKYDGMICAYSSPIVSNGLATWPEVRADDWCGDWEAIPD